jgi:hypothetical protein
MCVEVHCHLLQLIPSAAPPVKSPSSPLHVHAAAALPTRALGVLEAFDDVLIRRSMIDLEPYGLGKNGLGKKFDPYGKTFSIF